MHAPTRLPEICDESFHYGAISGHSAIATASQQRYLAFMLVCICNAISEDELRSIARQGISDPEAAFAALGKRPNCRTCLDHADDVLFSEQRRHAGTRPAGKQTPPTYANA